ncbi:metallophosphoesterase [bacterium]|nr:metallophosphoesterase [bacterium]
MATESPERVPSLRQRRRRPGHVLLLLLPVAILALPAQEAQRLQITTPVVRVPGLPPEFAGLRLALLADIHRGPFMSERRVVRLVHRTNEQKPDVVALGGDYVHRNRKYIPSVWKDLGGLHAPLGVYAVLGNHDHWEGAELTAKAMAHAHITNLTNRSVRLQRGKHSLVIAGLDDPWAGRPDLPAALAGVGPREVAIVICHNPDYVEQAHDPRVKLWLTGHTHGGQVCLPGGRPLVNISRCGYVSGLRQLQGTQVYTTRGVGTVAPPVRWNCPAELPVIELQPATPHAKAGE